MKKLITFVLAAFMCICFAACSSDAPETQPADNAAVSTEEAAVTPETTAVPPEETVSAETTVSKEDTIKDTVEETDNFHPQIQDIRNFLVLETPYDVCMGDYGSMDFMYSLKHGEEELIQQFIDKLVVNNYGLNLVDVDIYDYESAYYKAYQFMYRGKGERNLQRENMDWDVSIGITTHKDHNEVIAGIYYVNGFELVDDGHRADYSKVEYPADTGETTSSSSSASAQQQASAAVDKNASFIPDFSAFLNRNPSEDKDSYYGGYRKYYQKLPLETQKTVVAEILALLDNDRYQLELIEKVEGSNRIEYNYRYTGNAGMDSIHSKNDDSRYYNLQFTVYNKNNDNGTYGIHFHYSPQFAAENVGYTVSANTDSGSSGGSTTPDYERNDLPDHSKLPCLTCHGDGDCNECGGSIYVYVGGTRTKCNSCKGSGNCRTCGGSGTRN